MFLNAETAYPVDWHMENNLTVKGDGNDFIMRAPKALGGNADDRWIWKGKLPTTAAWPFPENKSSPFPSNRLPINHPVILADINTGNSADVLTVEKDVADNSDKLVTETFTATYSDRTDWSPLKITQLSHTEISTLKSIDSDTASSLSLNYNFYSPFPATLNDTNLIPSGATQEKLIDHIPTSSEMWSPAQPNDDFLPSFTKTPSDVYTNNLRLTDMTDNNITNLGENVYEPYIAIASILIMLLIISVIGNSLILFTILSKNYLRRTFFVLYVSLAASDLLASIMCVPILALIILRSHVLSSGVCSFIAAAFVLTTYTSVGSVASISAIRWWQFYNFTQTKTQEKTVVRLVIFALWITGFGIVMGFVSKDIIQQDKSCSLGHVTHILQNLFPVAVTTITLGLCSVLIVNGLTICKIKQKSIYNSDHQLTPRQAFVKFSRLVGYPFSSVETNDNYDLNSMARDDNGKIKKRVCHFNQRVRKKKIKTNKSNTGNPSCELPMQSPQPSSAPDPSTHGAKCYNKKKSLTNLTSTKTAESKYETHVTISEKTNTFQDGSYFLQKNLSIKDPQGSYSDIESEHLYEVMEPQDNQEHLTNTEAVARHNATENFIPLPNVIESQYSHETVTVKHETTIVNPVSPPNKHVCRTAWKLSRLPKIYFTKENTTAEPILKRPVEYVPSEESLKQSPWPLLQSPLTRGQCQETNCSNLQCREVHKLRELPEITTENKTCLSTYFPLVEIQDSLCAGYMADLSAPSSKHSTPNRKYRKRHIPHRSSAKINLLSAGESDDESQYANNEQNSSVTSRAGRRVHYQSCCKPSGETPCPSEDLAMHPVRQKCVHTSQRLIGLYSAAYLPLLLLDIPILFTTPDILVLFTVMYIALLQAIHSSLYSLQSPILKNAIQKLVKRLLSPSKTTVTRKNRDLIGKVQRNPTDKLSENQTKHNPTATEKESTERPSSEPPQKQKQPSSPGNFCRPSSH